MEVKTSIFTSQPVANKKTKSYHGAISSSIENEMFEKDSDSKVRCATQIKEGVIFILCEIIADSEIDASAVVRSNLNKFFQQNSLFPSSQPKTS